MNNISVLLKYLQRYKIWDLEVLKEIKTQLKMTSVSSMSKFRIKTKKTRRCTMQSAIQKAQLLSLSRIRQKIARMTRVKANLARVRNYRLVF
jgi:hypothetical protein